MGKKLRTELQIPSDLKKEYTAYSGPEYTIEWYFDEKGHSQPSTYFDNLNSRRQNKLMYLFRRMGDFGKILDITKFRNEGDGIYAFKPQPDRFLCFFKGNRIIVTNAFQKKQDKLPAPEKRTALRSRKEYEMRLKGGTYYDRTQ